MNGYAFDAKRKKETKNKVVFQEVENGSGATAVGGLYVEKWLVDELSKNVTRVEQIKVTIEVKQ